MTRKMKRESDAMKTVNLKAEMPTVQMALVRLSQEIAIAKGANLRCVKFIHGYGSHGVGGEIRIAVQKRLLDMAEGGEIRSCIFGEDWGPSDERTWSLLNTYSELKQDRDLGKRNFGITIVWF